MDGNQEQDEGPSASDSELRGKIGKERACNKSKEEGRRRRTCLSFVCKSGCNKEGKRRSVVER